MRRNTRRRSTLVLLALSIAAAGCGTSEQQKQELEQEKAVKAYQALEGRIQDQEQVRSKQAAGLNPAFLQSSNKLGLQLLQKLNKEKEPGINLVLSPYSVSEAVGMAWQGSAGPTSDEMAAALGWQKSSQSEVAARAKELREYLSLPAEGIKLRSANAIWHQEQLKLLPAFESSMTESYDAALEAADLTAPETIPAMNAWAAQHTEGMIKEVFDPAKSFSDEQKAILMNAVYFKGKWKDEFDSARTKQEAFQLANGTKIQADMMSAGGYYDYFQNDRLQAVRIPYQQDGFNLLLVVPEAKLSVQDLLPDLNRYTEWEPSMKPGGGSISLPRFKASTISNLIPAMQELGMKQAFQAEMADFSAMFQPSPYSDGLHIDIIQHQAVIEVNEKGTEAAAVTAIAAGTASAVTPFEFRADRPFFFAIEDTTAGIWLFLGFIQDPDPKN